MQADEPSYVFRLPTGDATVDEAYAIEIGRADFEAGDFMSLGKLLDEMKQPT